MDPTTFMQSIVGGAELGWLIDERATPIWLDIYGEDYPSPRVFVWADCPPLGGGVIGKILHPNGMFESFLSVLLGSDWVTSNCYTQLSFPEAVPSHPFLKALGIDSYIHPPVSVDIGKYIRML